MDSHKIMVAIAAGDDSWRVMWSADTGSDPHAVAKMARELASVAATAAVGQWPAQNVADTVARISREFPSLPTPEFETRSGAAWIEPPSEAPQIVAVDAAEPDPILTHAPLGEPAVITEPEGDDNGQ